MEDATGFLAVALIFLGLPWLMFHYITKWKSASSLTGSDEKLLDELHDMARRLDDRLCTIERIMNAESPDWQQACLPEAGAPLADDILTARTRRGEKA